MNRKTRIHGHKLSLEYALRVINDDEAAGTILEAHALYEVLNCRHSSTRKGPKSLSNGP